MGNKSSLMKKEATTVSRKIVEESPKDESEGIKEVKILLLGQEGSGKSTVVEQMRIMCGLAYTEQDCTHYRRLVHSNSIQYLVTIILAMKKLAIDFADSSRRDDAEKFLKGTETSTEVELTPGLCEVMQRLWNDAGTQRFFARSKEFHLSDSAGYYLNSLTRLSPTYYKPSAQDILRTRERTNGILPTQFTSNNLRFIFYDVGGQISERKRWFNCFKGIFLTITIQKVHL